MARWSAPSSPSAYPRTGGVYVFLKEIYSPLLGFVWGWAMFWSMHTGILAAIATVFARYAGFFVPLSDTGLRVVAIGAILVLSAINYVGVRFGGRVQTAFTVVKVLAVVAIIVLGWALSGDAPAPAPSAALPPVTLTNFSLAVAAGPVRVRRLAHGHLHRRRNDQPDAHHSALADDRHRRRHGLLHRA